MSLMGNELFGDIHPETYHLAAAIELFHNFTLVHDDIMDNAALRRGMPTIHEKYGSSTALLSGDIMVIAAYEQLNKIKSVSLHQVLALFTQTAREVCEGQQLDMDFEKNDSVSLNQYLRMIELKTSVLLAASLSLGAMMGGASKGNLDHIYEFGRNLGIAFQVQDDYLDAFGDPEKFGKEQGGDIKQNKKTFLLIHALETCSKDQHAELMKLMKENAADKIEKVLSIYKDCNVADWAIKLKNQYVDQAEKHLENIAVLSSRKKPLQELSAFLVQREY
ncbi:MAG: polyprenyl synthetase family protein [Chitinophagaceae bacterium]|nr:polyprenyl synthetase family protein [Chitinophagaceae bacterium]